jgi:uncharacterized membrane protein
MLLGKHLETNFCSLRVNRLAARGFTLCIFGDFVGTMVR